MVYFKPTELLKRSPPTRRASYTDRMAWLMAEMSKLAYFRFESLVYRFVKIPTINYLKNQNYAIDVQLVAR